MVMKSPLLTSWPGASPTAKRGAIFWTRVWGMRGSSARIVRESGPGWVVAVQGLVSRGGVHLGEFAFDEGDGFGDEGFEVLRGRGDRDGPEGFEALGEAGGLDGEAVDE